MISKTQIVIAKTHWSEILRMKVNKWKADTDIYVSNSESLLRDDIIDIAKGVWKQTVVTPKTHKLQELYLDEDGDLPYPFALRLDALRAYAVDMGIDIDYIPTYKDGNIVIDWVVNSIADHKVIDNYVSGPMRLTRARLIEEVAEEVAN